MFADKKYDFEMPVPPLVQKWIDKLRDEGREEARKEAREEIRKKDQEVRKVKMMLQDGLSVEKIIKYTGVSLEEIEKLQNELL